MRWIFAPASLLFEGLSFFRWKLYRIGFLKSRRAPAPVISVGNISLGGTGKTPCVIWLVEKLIEKGYEPVVLTRGYKREKKERLSIHGDIPEALLAGDEPAMMAKKIPNTTIVVHPDRLGSALEIGSSKNRIFVLDDGFQHLSIARDFDIVLLDGKDPYSGGHFAPWGNLRDGLWRLSGADAIIVVGGKIDENFLRKSIPQRIPVFSAKKSPKRIVTLDGKEIAPTSLAGMRILAFAGIADPGSFLESLRMFGLDMAGIVSFPDHYRYKMRDIERIESIAAEKKTDILITTDKDAVRLAGITMRLTTYILEITFEPENPSKLLDLVLGKLAKNKP